ncbi:MAG: hypothetical protein ACX932_05270 [Gammaproteobacteria bacterium]
MFKKITNQKLLKTLNPTLWNKFEKSLESAKAAKDNFEKIKFYKEASSLLEQVDATLFKKDDSLKKMAIDVWSERVNLLMQGYELLEPPQLWRDLARQEYFKVKKLAPHIDERKDVSYALFSEEVISTKELLSDSEPEDDDTITVLKKS